MKLIPSKWLLFCLSVISAGLLSGCEKKPAAPPQRPPAEVSVLTVTTAPVSLTTELPGRINPVREAQVRARATGILLKRLFEEGANVKEGDVLFEIDPEPLEAQLNSAKASLARAEASLKESTATVARYKDLVKINAISQQAYDEAQATLGENEAEVLAGKAAVRTAELNLGYAKVTAPISGRIGRALVPNPENMLLPGMFVRGQIVQRVVPDAITIPQRTVTMGAGGNATVLVVNNENKVELRKIDIDRMMGTKVLVARGLKAGERIIVEGSQKAPPGSVVAPVPFNSTPAAGSVASAAH